MPIPCFQYHSTKSKILRKKTHLKGKHDYFTWMFELRNLRWPQDPLIRESDFRRLLQWHEHLSGASCTSWQNVNARSDGHICELNRVLLGCVCFTGITKFPIISTKERLDTYIDAICPLSCSQKYIPRGLRNLILSSWQACPTVGV